MELHGLMKLTGKSPENLIGQIGKKSGSPKKSMLGNL